MHLPVHIIYHDVFKTNSTVYRKHHGFYNS